MSSFGDAISFAPMEKEYKKVKPSKLVKGKAGKGGKPAKNMKPLKKGKPKGRKPGFGASMLDPEPGPMPGPSKNNKKKEEVIDMEQQFILRMPPVRTFWK